MELVSRYEARQQGLKHFYTGVACPNGHITERYTKSGMCVSCSLGKNQEARKIAKRRGKRGQYLGWNPTNVERDGVRRMVANGIPTPLVCQIMGIAERTLRKYCQHDLTTAAAEANDKVAGSLFWMATEGPIQQRLPAAIFWLKVRAGWKEVEYIEMLRPPSEMTDDELAKAIQFARQSSGRKSRKVGGRVVSLADFRAGAPGAA